MRTSFTTDEATARELDAVDPLRRYREKFFLPPGKIYFDGNSLGLMAKCAQDSLTRVADEWKQNGIRGWWDIERDWWHTAERLGADVAEMMGAAPAEVVAAGTTTVNLHTLVGTFYQPQGTRTKILADELTFPSDLYALRGQVRLRGFDPSTHLKLVSSDDGRFLDEGQIVSAMADDVALVLLPSVLYRSGQMLDLELLTREAHKRGIIIGFDCSHSAGVVRHRFDQWNVDFAFWCGFKYLNGGPGCPGFLFVNSHHFEREPGLPGWFGYEKQRQFDMLSKFRHNRSAAGWQISSPGILGMAPLEGALEIIHEATIDAIREKSLGMTSYMMFLVDEMLPEAEYGIVVGTPREPERRGGHVALEHVNALKIFEALKEVGVIGDFRSPNVVRLAPTPLYNSYQEIWKVVRHIRQIIDSGAAR